MPVFVICMVSLVLGISLSLSVCVINIRIQGEEMSVLKVNGAFSVCYETVYLVLALPYTGCARILCL